MVTRQNPIFFTIFGDLFLKNSNILKIFYIPKNIQFFLGHMTVDFKGKKLDG